MIGPSPATRKHALLEGRKRPAAFGGIFGRVRDRGLAKVTRKMGLLELKKTGDGLTGGLPGVGRSMVEKEGISLRLHGVEKYRLKGQGSWGQSRASENERNRAGKSTRGVSGDVWTEENWGSFWDSHTSNVETG